MPDSSHSEAIRIVPTDERYVESFNRALDIVARERRYIGFLEGPPVESTRSWVRQILSGEGVRLFAITREDDVVGWCDIARNRMDGFRAGRARGLCLECSRDRAVPKNGLRCRRYEKTRAQARRAIRRRPDHGAVSERVGLLSTR